jgi:uncharacterized membrane protein required for colicin V production
VTQLDWIAIGVVSLAALAGLRRGLVGTALSLGGLVGGAVIGTRLAPGFLAQGARSPYTPVAALVGAVAGAIVLQAITSMIASFARSGLRIVPPLRALDSLGGLFAGAAWGLVLVWVTGAVALQLPGQTSFRQDVQRSEVLRRLNTIAPPSEVLQALGRIDQLPALLGPAPPTRPPDPRVLAEAAVRSARPSVVRVTAMACGLGVEGSGWVVDRHLVVTAAHVVAGAKGIRVNGLPARAYVLDRADDIAVLGAPKLSARPIPYADPHYGQAVAILGYPENGPFDGRAGRTGVTARVLVSGRPRTVTSFSGLVRHGNSGGPLVDAAGVVRATVFAARAGSTAGYGVPASVVRAVLEQARGPISTGNC